MALSTRCHWTAVWQSRRKREYSIPVFSIFQKKGGACPICQRIRRQARFRQIWKISKEQTRAKPLAKKTGADVTIAQIWRAQCQNPRIDAAASPCTRAPRRHAKKLCRRHEGREGGAARPRLDAEARFVSPLISPEAQLEQILTLATSSINQRAARKYPEQYKRASERYPAPVDY